jgi:hypothetical protein
LALQALYTGKQIAKTEGLEGVYNQLIATLRFVNRQSSGNPDLLAVFGNRASAAEIPIEPNDLDHSSVVLEGEIKVF